MACLPADLSMVDDRSGEAAGMFCRSPLVRARHPLPGGAAPKAKARYWRLAAVLAFAASGHAAQAASLTLSPVWGDHGVIQREAPVVVGGTAAPGAQVRAMLGDAEAQARADRTGHFALTFPARQASETPVDLTVEAGGEKILRHDLLVGDVWLCSGQSNMEFPVARALNGGMEAAMSQDPQLRLLTIPQAISFAPKDDFARPVAWQAAGRESVIGFSAACYFMLRDLRKALKVPMGAIHSSWGGSQIRPWLSPEAGLALYGSAEMASIKHFENDPLAAVTAFSPRWEAWYRGATGGSQPWLQPDTLSWQPVPSIKGWLAWEGTPLAAKPLGTVWLRRQVTLSREQAAAGAVLALGVLDDMDVTYVNGRVVGNSFGWDYQREYRLPPAYLHEGVNEIMVAVTNTYGNGGFASSADKLALRIAGGETMPLGDGWRFSISGAGTNPPRTPWDANAGIGVMHNRMIAPLGTFALKGAVWYQGESDVDTPGYADRLKALIAGWRRQFGAKLAVEIVQLANYGPVRQTPGASTWAALRDDQRRVAAADPQAALVSAIDIGERTDIHPANKPLLGKRLALAARGVAMPMPVDARREAGAIRIRFSGIEGGLQAWSAPGPIGFELCDGAGQCRYAAARADGDSVVLADDGKPVAQVRYAWADSPVVNLFDGRAMPVPGFALPVMP